MSAFVSSVSTAAVGVPGALVVRLWLLLLLLSARWAPTAGDAGRDEAASGLLLLGGDPTSSAPDDVDRTRSTAKAVEGDEGRDQLIKEIPSNSNPHPKRRGTTGLFSKDHSSAQRTSRGTAAGRKQEGRGEGKKRGRGNKQTRVATSK